MIVNTPPMGWNSWNTFAHNINEELVMQMADFIVEQGYKDAGYEYVVIDDCWSQKERDENERLVADPVKFPHGMKYVADYIHSKGLKFGMYSCAGARTCAGYPGSYEHEYIDAETFAEWGVDFLKYDYCHFNGDMNSGKLAYLTMSMALRATGRDIVLSACQWGEEDPAKWMRSVGAHMYRSTADIFDIYESQYAIMNGQMFNFNNNAPGCFNDLDMLTVGMYGKGHVARTDVMTYDDYESQFAFWCFMGSPLMMGCDLTKVDNACKKLLQNKELIRINQDKECRAPYYFYKYWGETHAFMRQLENNEFAIGVFRLRESAQHFTVSFRDFGIPRISGRKIEITDILTGEKLGVRSTEFIGTLKTHGCKIYRCKFVD